MELFEGFRYGFNSVLIPVILLLSLLMVSTVPFDKIPRVKKGHFRLYRHRYYLFFFYFITIITLQEYGLILVFTIFIAKGVIMAIIRFWRDIHHEPA